MSGPLFEKRAVEADFERWVMRFALARGWRNWKLTSLSRRGWPDRGFARRGVLLLVELKLDGSGELSANQIQCHKELAAAGIKVYVLWTKAQAIDLFD